MNCVSVEEAIWDSARTGAQPPDAVLRHAEQCASCAQALKDALAAQSALASLQSCPPAPDCRAAVMARIEEPGNRRVGFRWAYALAVIALVVGAYLGLALQPGRHSGDRVRQAAKPGSRPAARQVEKRAVPRQQIADKPVPVREERAPQPPRVQNPKRSAEPYHRDRKPTRHNSIRRHAPRLPDPSTTARAKESIPTVDTRRVAVVVVSWEGKTQPSPNYEYSRTDPNTGVTTQCRVTQTNGVVEVDMQSSPRPDNGGTNHETIPGA